MPVIEIGNGINESAVSSLIATAVANLVNSAPSTLDTLNELALALGNDASFATTITNALAGKASSSHTHSQSDITNLISDLASKASSTHTHAMSDITGLVSALAGKATPSDITTAINNLVNSAPGALDTLSELATALGNDANFASTITTALAGKAPQSTTYTKTEVDSAIAAGAGGNGTALTAGGTIAIGDLIETYDSGSAVYKSRKVTAEVSGVPQTILTPHTDNGGSVTVWHPTASRFLTIYSNQLVSNYLQTIVSSVSGTTITAQAPVSQVSLATSRVYAFYDSDQDAVICAFEQTGGTAGIYVCQFTISGNTATMSTPQSVVATYTAFSSFIKFGTNKYVATYGVSASGHKVIAMTVSAGVFTFGTAYTTPTSENANYVAPVWDSSQSKLFFFFTKQTSTPKTFCYVVLTISGTTWTQAQGETTIFNSGNYAPHWQGVYYNGYIYVLVQGYDFAQTYYGFLKFSIATNTLTLQKFIPIGKGSVTLASYGIAQNGTDVYVNMQTGRLIVKCTLTSSDLLIDSKIYQKQTVSGSTSHFIIAGSVFGFFYNDGNKYFKGVIYTTLPTISKTVGIAIEAATSGQSKKVALNGQIATGLSGLIAGTQYYIQNDGTISQNWTPNRVGRAITDTQLSVNIFEEFIYGL